MSKRWIGSAFVVTGLVVACGGGKGGGGGGSGVAGGKTLGMLSASEARSICEYLADLQGDPRTVTCPDNSTIMITAETEEQIQNCADQLFAVTDACTTTVSQAEDCFEDLAALTDQQRFCEDTALPASCAPVMTQECG